MSVNTKNLFWKNDNPSMSRIHILPPEEARRIAAGEVIDRPAALIREFIDNAIDSGASNIDVSIEGGGSKKAEVADDGIGMGRDDLALCALAHATSKINSLDDLRTSSTLGFRGEALASVAAAAHLEIISSASDGDSWRLDVGPGDTNPVHIEHAGRTRGSTVRALNLYDTMPARKQFLKREGSEAALCRQVFVEKALPFYRIAFRFNQDGLLKNFFPAVSSLKERFAASLPDENNKSFLHEIHVNGEGFYADIVIGGPEIYRSDRRLLYVFANGRRIQDYSLMQAMEYGTQGWFPNGVHPVGAVYLNIDPSLADFNIHPAKREARFMDPGAIHQAITAALRDYFHHITIKQKNISAQNIYEPEQNLLVTEALDRKHPVADKVVYDTEAIKNINFVRIAAEEKPSYDEIKYAGRAFGLFIMVECNNKIYIIDQHAAHERILYNRFLAGNIPKQELLVPLSFNTENNEEDKFLESKKAELANLAIVIDRDGNGWRIDALPGGWHMNDTETVQAILELSKAGENFGERWAATLSCHQAIRDGDYIDEKTALSLAKDAFALPDPRCPHGRPIWTEISREALCKAVRRS